MATNSKATQKKADAKRAGKRGRNWATIVYPESAPADWQQRLEDLKVCALVSPLHDQDHNPDGTPKKAHWHVLIKYDTYKTQEEFETHVAAIIGGVGAIRVGDYRQMARYLCHLDNPSKHQYSPADVKQFGGADYLTVIETAADKYNTIGDILDFCAAKQLYSYRQLMDYSREKRPDWFRCLCDNGTYVVKEYLKSAFWEECGGGYGIAMQPLSDKTKIRPKLVHQTGRRHRKNNTAK